MSSEERPSAVAELLRTARVVAAECRTSGSATRGALASLCMAVDALDSLSEVVKLDEYDNVVERCVDLSEKAERFRVLYATEAHKKQVLLEEVARLKGILFTWERGLNAALSSSVSNPNQE